MPLFGTQGAWQGQERLTAEVRRALRSAEALAGERGARAASADHLFAALLLERESSAVLMLERSGIDVAALRTELSHLLGDEARFPERRAVLDAAAREAVILGLNEARRAGLMQAGAGHLVLGLIETGDGSGVRFLKRSGVQVRELRQQLHALESVDEAVAEESFQVQFASALQQWGGGVVCATCAAPLHETFAYCYACGVLQSPAEAAGE